MQRELPGKRRELNWQVFTTTPGILSTRLLCSLCGAQCAWFNLKYLSTGSIINSCSARISRPFLKGTRNRIENEEHLGSEESPRRPSHLNSCESESLHFPTRWHLLIQQLEPGVGVQWCKSRTHACRFTQRVLSEEMVHLAWKAGN